jgi:hypothetical protein
LAHGFRGLNPWSLGSMLLGRTSYWQEHVIRANSLHGGQEAASEEGLEARHNH